jgi:hypothetical protein
MLHLSQKELSSYLNMHSALLLSLLPLALAGSSSGANCFHITIPVHVVVPTYPLKFPQFKNGCEVTEFLLQTTKRDAPQDPTPLFDTPKNISKTDSISARYCSLPVVILTPKTSKQSKFCRTASASTSCTGTSVAQSIITL